MAKGFKKALLIALAMIVGIVAVNAFVMNADKIFNDNDATIEDYEMTIDLQSDGRAIVHERHNINFDNRGNPWWNYYKNFDFTAFNNTELDMASLTVNVDGVPYPMYPTPVDFEDDASIVNKHQYQNYAYSCLRKGKREIGVVMPEFTKGNKVIDISYNINNVLIGANDVAVFYYQIIPSNNAFPVNNVKTTITFPDNSDATMRSWLHITGASGNSTIIDNNKVEIVASKIPAKTYVETRLTLDKANYTAFGKIENKTLKDVEGEELSDFERDQAKKQRQKLFLIFDICLGVVAVIVCSILAIKDFAKKKRKEIVDAPVYLHEPPEGYKCEECMPIFHYYDDDEGWWSDSISATILSLVKNNYLKVIPGKKKKDAKIMIMNASRDELKPYEATVMDMIDAASHGGAISMDDFEAWCKRNYKTAASYLKTYKSRAMKRAIDDRLRRAGNMHKPPKRGAVVYGVGLGLSVLTFVATNPFFIFNILLSIAGIIMYLFDHMRFYPMNRAGEKLYMDCKAFEKYMLDFSNFDKKTIPDLILWEDYLIWATGMGIADEVSKQLSIVYPEYNEFYMADDVAGDFVFWYMFSPRIRVFNAASISDSMRNSFSAVTALKAADALKSTAASAASSFGRGGGSFSGGGGGLGGGGGMGAR